jgi:hypothetical protein
MCATSLRASFFAVWFTVFLAIVTSGRCAVAVAVSRNLLFQKCSERCGIFNLGSRMRRVSGSSCSERCVYFTLVHDKECGTCNPSSSLVCDVSVALGNRSNAAGRFSLALNQSLANVIDCLDPSEGEVHDANTHVYWVGNPLELIFTFTRDYDLSKVYFWNYNADSYDVDAIDFTFFNGQRQIIGSYSFLPQEGKVVSGSIRSQNATFPTQFKGVRQVSALLNATNGQVDFQNLLFAV